MKIYRVSAKQYWDGFEEAEGQLRERIASCYGFYRSRELTKRPINELIRKYELRNKNILAIGPSFGHEEYHYWTNGCALTFVDIDQHGAIMPYLEQIPRDLEAQEILTYCLGDVREYLTEVSAEAFDVVYFSSFALDERRRKEIKEKQIGIVEKCFNFIPKRLFNRIFFKEWPENEKPYADIVLEVGEKALKRDGLLIVQSYAWGLNILANPEYVQQIKSQFASGGIQLLNVFCVKMAPRIQLVVGMKSEVEHAKKYLLSIQANPPITRIHGRSEIDSEVVKVFDLLQETL